MINGLLNDHETLKDISEVRIVDKCNSKSKINIIVKSIDPFASFRILKYNHSGIEELITQVQSNHGEK